jgi:hypothetical protein
MINMKQKELISEVQETYRELWERISKMEHDVNGNKD